MGIASFQVGTAVTLDKGYLEFSKVTLTAYSAALPITAGDTYQFTGQVAGALAAPLGQGGRIVAAYTNVDGQSAGEDLLWQNPTNFNGTLAVQQTVTANANAATLRLALTAVLDAGHLDFGDFNRRRLTAGAVIRRSTYMLAGTAVAVRVSGDPDGNDGLHYLYSDHLGSASAIQNSDGSAPIITRYTPFGSYRAGSGTNAVTDRGFTGQPENMSLGLYYYQARFYVPGIGRFASADTIVPDPTNPQQYNRYTYTLNNPLRYSDPTGHCSFNPQSPHEYYHCLEQASNVSSQSGLSFGYLSQFDWGSLSAREIIQIWGAFVNFQQEILDAEYGYNADGGSQVPFAHNSRYNTVRPGTQAELIGMMVTGNKGINSLITNRGTVLDGNGNNINISGTTPGSGCHGFVGAVFDVLTDIHSSGMYSGNAGYWDNFEFRGRLYRDMSEGVVLFSDSPSPGGLPAHGAVMSVPDYINNHHSIILQVDGNISIGIFYTRISNSSYYSNFTPYFLYPNSAE